MKKEHKAHRSEQVGRPELNTKTKVTKNNFGIVCEQYAHDLIISCYAYFVKNFF